MPRDLQTTIGRFVTMYGVIEAAERLEVARETLIRLRKGGRVRPGTIAIVRQRLAAHGWAAHGWGAGG